MKALFNEFVNSSRDECKWNDQEWKPFDNLKQVYQNAQIMSQPDDEKPFYIQFTFCDENIFASNY